MTAVNAGGGGKLSSPEVEKILLECGTAVKEIDVCILCYLSCQKFTNDVQLIFVDHSKFESSKKRLPKVLPRNLEHSSCAAAPLDNPKSPTIKLKKKVGRPPGKKTGPRIAAPPECGRRDASTVSSTPATQLTRNCNTSSQQVRASRSAKKQKKDVQNIDEPRTTGLGEPSVAAEFETQKRGRGRPPVAHLADTQELEAYECFPSSGATCNDWEISGYHFEMSSPVGDGDKGIIEWDLEPTLNCVSNDNPSASSTAVGGPTATAHSLLDDALYTIDDTDAGTHGVEKTDVGGVDASRLL